MGAKDAISRLGKYSLIISRRKAKRPQASERLTPEEHKKREGKVREETQGSYFYNMAVYPLRTEDHNHQQQQINKFVDHELKVRFQHGNSESSKCNPRISMKNGDSYLMHSDAFKTIVAFMRKYGPFH